MDHRDYRDIFAGFGLALFGGAAAIFALANYATGTITRMGPGMMPAAYGILLVGLGLLIAIPAFLREGRKADLRLRSLIVLSACILSFAYMIENFGMVPSVFATTVIATFAESKVSFGRAVILAGVMAFVTWAIFILGLGLSIPAADWPF